MELHTLYVAEIAGKKYYFATQYDRTYFINRIYSNSPTTLITKYEIDLEE